MCTNQYMKELSDIQDRLKQFIDKSGKKPLNKPRELRCLEGSRIKAHFGAISALIWTDIPQDLRSSASSSTNRQDERQSKISKNSADACIKYRKSEEYSTSSSSKNSDISERNIKTRVTMNPISWEPEILKISTNEPLNDEMRISLKIEKFRKAVQDFHLKVRRDILNRGEHSSSDDSIDERIIKMTTKINASRPEANNFYEPISWEPKNPTFEPKTKDGGMNSYIEHQACMLGHSRVSKQDNFNMATMKIDSSCSIESPKPSSEESADLANLMAKIVTLQDEQHEPKNGLISSNAHSSRVGIMQSTFMKYLDSSARIPVIDESEIMNDIKMNGPTENDDLAPLGTYEEFEAQLLCRANH